MKYTFGRTQAAQRLETLLENSPSARRKVSSILSDFNYKLIRIISAKDPNTVKLCWALLRDYTLKRIDAKKGLTDDMRSYAKNVLIYRYRVYLHNFNDIVALLAAKRKGLTFGTEGV